MITLVAVVLAYLLCLAWRMLLRYQRFEPVPQQQVPHLPLIAWCAECASAEPPRPPRTCLTSNARCARCGSDAVMPVNPHQWGWIREDVAV